MHGEPAGHSGVDDFGAFGEDLVVPIGRGVIDSFGGEGGSEKLHGFHALAG